MNIDKFDFNDSSQQQFINTLESQLCDRVTIPISELMNLVTDYKSKFPDSTNILNNIKEAKTKIKIAYIVASLYVDTYRQHNNNIEPVDAIKHFVNECAIDNSNLLKACNGFLLGEYINNGISPKEAKNLHNFIKRFQDEDNYNGQKNYSF